MGRDVAAHYWHNGEEKNMAYMRHPRVGNERRKSDDAETVDLVRPSRRPHNLPDARDDVMHDFARTESWKRHRPTQYRPVRA
jgi:hypothetical protein